MAKSLYSALFDWIVLRINHALLNKKDMEESVPVRYRHSLTPTQKYLHTYTTVVGYFYLFSFLLLIVLSRCSWFCFPVLVHWCPGHFWLWRLWDQQLWTVLHQLRKRAAAVLFQPSHLQSGAGEQCSLVFIPPSNTTHRVTHRQNIYR